MSLLLANTMLLVSGEGESGVREESLGGEFVVRRARNGREGLELVSVHHPGLIVANLPLADMKGVDFISSVREWSSTPIIVVSNNPSVDAKATLLHAGADDYVVKPFGLDEFRARVRVAFRHHSAMRQDLGPVFRMGRTTIDLASKTILRDGERVHMAPIEFQLLAELVKQAEKVVTQRHLMSKVWGHTSRSNLPVLRAYIAILRKKLSTYLNGDIVIETIPGVGYRLFHT